MTFKPVRSDSSHSSHRKTSLIPSARRNSALSLPRNMISAENLGSSLIFKFDTDRFDATNTQMFIEAVEGISLESSNSILLHFEKVKLIDSSAVGVLLDFYKSLPPESRSISILSPQPAVASMIEFLRLHHVFQIKS